MECVRRRASIPRRETPRSRNESPSDFAPAHDEAIQAAVDAVRALAAIPGRPQIHRGRAVTQLGDERRVGKRPSAPGSGFRARDDRGVARADIPERADRLERDRRHVSARTRRGRGAPQSNHDRRQHPEEDGQQVGQPPRPPASAARSVPPSHRAEAAQPSRRQGRASAGGSPRPPRSAGTRREERAGRGEKTNRPCVGLTSNPATPVRLISPVKNSARPATPYPPAQWPAIAMLKPSTSPAGTTAAATSSGA